MRAHGETANAVAELVGDELEVRLRAPMRGVARGQTLVLYRADADGDEVLGSATIAATRADLPAQRPFLARFKNA